MRVDFLFFCILGCFFGQFGFDFANLRLLFMIIEKALRLGAADLSEVEPCAEKSEPPTESLT